MGKRSKQVLLQKDKQMAQKPMKRSSTKLVTRKMENKTTERCISTHTRMAKVTRTDNTIYLQESEISGTVFIDGNKK